MKREEVYESITRKLIIEDEVCIMCRDPEEYQRGIYGCGVYSTYKPKMDNGYLCVDTWVFKKGREWKELKELNIEFEDIEQPLWWIKVPKGFTDKDFRELFSFLEQNGHMEQLNPLGTTNDISILKIRYSQDKERPEEKVFIKEPLEIRIVSCVGEKPYYIYREKDIFV